MRLDNSDYPLRDIPTEVKTTFTFQCDCCKERVSQEYFGFATAYPGHPGEGWRQYGPGVWVCPKHSVRVIVDGKLLGDTKSGNGLQVEPSTE